MTFPFPNLTITFGTATINASPISAYHINDQWSRYVVLYNLSYRNELEKINSIVPYYISDGLTNNFRANMLYPFICVNELDNRDSGCATNHTAAHGLLFKYAVIKNLNSRYIYTWINNQIKERFGQRGIDFLKHELPTCSRDYTEGVSSVLLRIENLLDFFIAMCSERIMNNYPILSYRPYEPDPFNYAINSLGRNETHEYIDIYDYYRQGLLVSLKDFYKKFVDDYKFIVSFYLNLEFKPITTEEFNNLPEVKICRGRDDEVDDKIYFEQRNNTQNYINISNCLVDMIKPMLNFHTKDDAEFFRRFNHVQADQQVKFREQYCEFFGIFFKEFIIPAKIIYPPPSLDTNVRGWGASCASAKKVRYYDKYIKYKLKYLALKKI